MRTLVLLFIISFSSLLASPTNITLDLFSNASFISKTFSLEKSGDIKVIVPKTTNLEDFRHSMTKGCKIQKQSLSDTKESKDEEFLALKDKRQNLSYNLEALKAHSDLLKTLSLKDTQDANTIESLGALLKNNLIETAKEQYEISKSIKQIDKEIAKYPQKEFKSLHVTYQCDKKEGVFTIRYPQTARYQMFHTLQAKQNDKAINIKTQAKIFYNIEENFNNININLYSYTYNSLSAPRKFYPKYLGEKKPQSFVQARKKVMADATMESSLAPNNLSYNEDATKSHYSVRGVTLKANEDKLLDLDTETLDANFTNYIDAYGTNRAYIQVTFTPKKRYQAALNTLILDDMMIAKKHFPTLRKGEEAKIYFGENEHINIEKKLIKTLAEKTFFGDKRIATQNWKYTITNTKEYAEDILFATRTPVSKDANIIVKTTAQPAFDEKTAKGKTLWNFTLGANESKEIIFGYEVAKEES